MLLGIVVVLLVGAGIGALFWYGFRGKPNEGPALGNNRPYPSTLMPGDESPPYLPNPVISPEEEYRMSADEKLRRRVHPHRD